MPASKSAMPSSVVPSVLPIEPASEPRDMTDAQAVGCVLAGSREMFEVIVRRYNPRLYRVGMAYLRNHAQAEDAMQETYLKAFLNLGRFRHGSAFATWLTRIMINECLMLLRRQRRFQIASPSAETIESFKTIDESASPSKPDPIQAEEMKTLLEASLRQLPRTHRAVYLLREVENLTTAETARCLGLSRENVKVCLHRAREGLKSQILKSAAGVELFGYPARYCDPMTARVMLRVRSFARAN